MAVEFRFATGAALPEDAATKWEFQESIDLFSWRRSDLTPEFHRGKMVILVPLMNQSSPLFYRVKSK
jgi:hypothetical protein